MIAGRNYLDNNRFNRKDGNNYLESNADGSVKKCVAKC